MFKKTFSFYKEKDDRWYIDLPDWKGSKAELEMVMGADTMLDIISEKKDSVTLIISTKYFEGSDLLEFLRYENEAGGGWYLLKKYQGVEFNIEMWLCEVVNFVFGSIPKKIYISKTF